MLLLPLEPSQGVAGGAAPMQGMRASVTASMRFDGMPVATSAVIGSPGDYLREPLFSAGAWRTSAVTLGGIEGLLTETRKQLVMRGRENSPHQKARVGRAIIAEESARLWLRKAAIVAESRRQAPDDAVGYVNLARTAVETAAREIITLVQRSLGLACLLQANPVERRLRDLTTYLRQPAPDAALENGAARFMQRPLPDG